jgi:hypothetical protein
MRDNAAPMRWIQVRLHLLAQNGFNSTPKQIELGAFAQFYSATDYTGVVIETLHPTKSITCPDQIAPINQSLPNSSRPTS